MVFPDLAYFTTMDCTDILLLCTMVFGSWSVRLDMLCSLSFYMNFFLIPLPTMKGSKTKLEKNYIVCVHYVHCFWLKTIQDCTVNFFSNTMSTNNWQEYLCKSHQWQRKVLLYFIVFALIGDHFHHAQLSNVISQSTHFFSGVMWCI